LLTNKPETEVHFNQETATDCSTSCD